MNHDTIRSLRRLFALLRLGMADWRDVEAVGLRLLESGDSSGEVIDLASVTSRSGELSELVVATLTAADVEPPDIQEMVRIGAVEIARKILGGTVSAYAGARAIWRFALIPPRLDPDLKSFIGLASEWEDDVQNRAKYEEDILAHARSLIARIET